MAGNISIEQHSSVAILRLTGKLGFDLKAEATVRKPVEQLLAANQRKILLDVKNADFRDNVWLGAILSAGVSTVQQGGQFKLIASKNQKSTLEGFRWDTVLEIYVSEEEALASFQ